MGDEVYTFGSVATLAPSPEGAVYIADLHVPVVRKYDALGRYLRDLGKKGEGPGEYLSIDGLAVLQDGRLVLWDGWLRRLSYFSAEGTYTESFRILEGRGSWRGRLFVWTPRGDLLMAVVSRSGIFHPETDPGDWARVGPQGEVERLVSRPLPDRVGPRFVLDGRGGSYRPFSSETLSAMGPDGSFYQARNDRYEIRHLHPDGTETIIQREEAPIRVEGDERQEWEAWSEYFVERAERPERRDDYRGIPKVKPYIRMMMVDADGRLWVCRYTEAVFVPHSEAERGYRGDKGWPDQQWLDRPVWDLFGPEDRYLGSVTLPFKTTLAFAMGDEVWGIQAGELAEDYVVRWRMVPEG